MTLDKVATSTIGRHIKYEPYAFTEQGVAMLSSVLNSKKAVQVNIAIMRAFVRVRQILSTRKDIAAEMNKLKAEQKYQRADIKRIFKIIDSVKNRSDIKGGKEEVEILKSITMDALADNHSFNVSEKELNSYYLPFASRALLK